MLGVHLASWIPKFVSFTKFGYFGQWFLYFFCLILSFLFNDGFWYCLTALWGFIYFLSLSLTSSEWIISIDIFALPFSFSISPFYASWPDSNSVMSCLLFCKGYGVSEGSAQCWVSGIEGEREWREGLLEANMWWQLSRENVATGAGRKWHMPRERQAEWT